MYVFFLGKGLGECIGNRRISQFKLHATGALALGGGFSSCELKLSLTLILAFLQHRCAAQPAQAWPEHPKRWGHSHTDLPKWVYLARG